MEVESTSFVSKRHLITNTMRKILESSTLRYLFGIVFKFGVFIYWVESLQEFIKLHFISGDAYVIAITIAFCVYCVSNMTITHEHKS